MLRPAAVCCAMHGAVCRLPRCGGCAAYACARPCAVQRCEAASAVQRASEDEARVLRLDRERLAADVARVSDELESVRRSKEAELAQAAVVSRWSRR